MASIRSVRELADVEGPAWPELLERLQAAGPSVTVLDVDPGRGEAVLHALQVTARSTLGALALNCGGLLVQDGWLRLLAGEHGDLPDLAEANQLGTPQPGQTPLPSLLVALDVLGGQFAIDGGGLGVAPGQVCYFGPDTLSWLGLGGGHSDFVAWACGDAVGDFYADLRDRVPPRGVVDGVHL